LGLLTRYLGLDRNERTTVTPGRVAQPKPSGAQRGFFFPQAGKSAPVGVRTPYLRVPPVVPQPTGLTTFGKFSKDLICIVYFVGQHFLESLI